MPVGISYRAIGFYPAQSHGLFIQNIYNDNRNQSVIDPQVLDVIGQYIDAEIVEDGEEVDFVG